MLNSCNEPRLAGHVKSWSAVSENPYMVRLSTFDAGRPPLALASSSQSPLGQMLDLSISGGLHSDDAARVRVRLTARCFAKDVRPQFVPRNLRHRLDSQNVMSGNGPTAGIPLGNQGWVHFEQASHRSGAACGINRSLNWRHGLLGCVHGPNIAVLFIHVNSIAVRVPEHLQIASLYA